MFSVVIPLYNKEKSIASTLQSVLNQTFTDFEIVLVNDGSTDNSLEIAKKVIDPRIRIIDKPNGGVSSARNRGIEEARYAWICFLDADDLWEKIHLETVFDLISKFPQDKVFCTSFIYSNEKMPSIDNATISVIEDYFVEAKKEHFFWTSVTAINKEVFNNVGNFKEHLSRGEDLDLWARIGRKNRFIKSNLVTAIYVQDSENKLTFSRTHLRKSILNEIYFKGLTKSEKAYFQKLIINKIKASLLRKDFYIAYKLLLKYNFKLI